MDIKGFREWARRKLGDDGKCTVKVELTEDQFDQALDDAKDWWNSHHGLHKEAQLNIASGQSFYDLSAVTPGVDDVLKVWLPDRYQLLDFRGLYPGFLDVNGFPYGTLGLHSDNNPQGTLVQIMQNISSAQRVFSSDPDWEFYSDNMDKLNPVRELRIYPPPNDGGVAYYFYRVDPKDIKLHMYSQRDLWLIREWALAECKYMLGRIRGKYTGGLPAAGGDRTLDGDTLLVESREDKDRLEQKIYEYGGPVLPLVG